MSEPLFYDYADKARHEWLIQRGYRYYGKDQLKSYAYLYQKRFCEHEADHYDPDKCCLNVVRYDHSDCLRNREVSNPIGYEVDMYFERKDGVACKILLYGFPADQLETLLPGLEADALSMWDASTRKHYPDSSS